MINYVIFNSIENYDKQIREDTHKKVFFLSGQTTMGVGMVNPPDH